MTSIIPMGETPYSFVYGTKTVIPGEIGMPTFRMANKVKLRLNLDLLDEKMECA